MIKVGIIGCGFIGGALNTWLQEHNPEVEVSISDPYKGYNDDVSHTDIVFISIHIPTECDGTQNLDVLREIITRLPSTIPIFIRTTVLPHTCDTLSKELNKRVYFMPEFLTERTAYEDFCSQAMIFTAEEELLAKIFRGKKYITMTSLEAELVKYAHNVFGAVKVTYFNAIHALCQDLNCNYKNIQKGVLLSGYINDTHTYVPGPDGRMGYGGKCFPKDVRALYTAFPDTPVGKIAELVDFLNTQFRS